MKIISIFIFLSAFAICAIQVQQDKSRLVILADIGNEPDGEQQIVHMMMYTNEFDFEGLIAVTGKYLNPNSKNK